MKTVPVTVERTHCHSAKVLACKASGSLLVSRHSVPLRYLVALRSFIIVERAQSMRLARQSVYPLPSHQERVLSLPVSQSRYNLL